MIYLGISAALLLHNCLSFALLGMKIRYHIVAVEQWFCIWKGFMLMMFLLYFWSCFGFSGHFVTFFLLYICLLLFLCNFQVFCCFCTTFWRRSGWGSENDLCFDIWVGLCWLVYQTLCASLFVWIRSLEVFVEIQLLHWSLNILRRIIHSGLLKRISVNLLWSALLFLFSSRNLRLFFFVFFLNFLHELVHKILIGFRRYEPLFISMHGFKSLLVFHIEKSWINSIHNLFCFLMSLLLSKLIECLNYSELILKLLLVEIWNHFCWGVGNQQQQYTIFHFEKINKI